MFSKAENKAMQPAETKQPSHGRPMDQCGCGACVRHRAIERGWGHKIYSGFTQDELVELGGGVLTGPPKVELTRGQRKARDKHQPAVDEAQAVYEQRQDERTEAFQAMMQARAAERRAENPATGDLFNPMDRIRSEQEIQSAEWTATTQTNALREAVKRAEQAEADALEAVQKARVKLLKAEAGQRSAMAHALRKGQ